MTDFRSLMVVSFGILVMMCVFSGTGETASISLSKLSPISSESHQNERSKRGLESTSPSEEEVAERNAEIALMNNVLRELASRRAPDYFNPTEQIVRKRFQLCLPGTDCDTNGWGDEADAKDILKPGANTNPGRRRRRSVSKEEEMEIRTTLRQGTLNGRLNQARVFYPEAHELRNIGNHLTQSSYAPHHNHRSPIYEDDTSDDLKDVVLDGKRESLI